MMCYFSDASCLARVLLSRVDQIKFELETFKFERKLSFWVFAWIWILYILDIQIGNPFQALIEDSIPNFSAF